MCTTIPIIWVIRLSYNAADGGGAAVLEESNYYPFGLRHQGYNEGSLLNDFGIAGNMYTDMIKKQ